MTTRTIIAITIYALALTASAGASSGGPSENTSPVAKRAPLNPAFLDWQTNEAYRTACRRHGYRPSLVAPMKVTKPKLSKALGAGQAEVLPVRFSLCDSNWVTSVKNQSPYGACWAHATMASLESWILRTEGMPVDLSENNLTVRHGFDWGFNDGGNGDMAAAYLLRWDGPLLESEDPYPNPSSWVTGLPYRHVQRVIKLPAREDAGDNGAIKRALVKFGPVMASYCDLNGYVGYAESYNSTTAAYYCTIDYGVNHAVAVVGWDDDYPASNFSTTPPGNGAFIIKNSWGTGFGDQGYIYVSYYDVPFGRQEDMYVFASAEGRSNYGRVYQHDPLGNVSNMGYSGDVVWAANVFTAAEASVIDAVGFYTLAPNAEYQVYVYVGCNSSNPRSGTLGASKSGTREYAGYDTVKLQSAVNVPTGQKFSVVVKTTSPGHAHVAIETAIKVDDEDYSSGATASTGESFINADPAHYSWEDISAGGDNCCIKAYTQSPGAEPLAISSQTFDDATQGRSYYSSLAVSGGTPPYSWSLIGNLPTGLSLGANGVISGVPTVTGTFTFGATVTDAASETVATANNAFSITVNADTALAGDDFEVPVDIAGASGSYHINDFAAYSIEDDEPLHTLYNYSYSSQYASAWFKWTAPGNGTVTFTSRSRGGVYVYPTFVAIYTGEEISSATRIAFSKDYKSSGDYSTSCSLSVAEGTVYRIVAVLGSSTSTADLTFSWSGTFAPPTHTETQTTEVPVPYSWLDQYYPGTADYEACAKAAAANGLNHVWEAYVAGLIPTNPASVFTAMISMDNGAPKITWRPDLNENGTKSVRQYKVWGRESLNIGDWIYPTNALHRFFKVTVGMP